MGTSDRRPYLSATALDQSLLNECSDNLTIQLEMIADIIGVGVVTTDLHFSDRAKYVGTTFYEPRTNFPVLKRTIGDWLAGTIEFSNLVLTVNNTDSKYNQYLPGGGNFDGFIGRQIDVKAGLGEDASTYTIVFSGEITDVSGFERDTSSFTLTARNDLEKVNISIPNEVLIPDTFPDIEDGFVGVGAPVIYGDWTTNLRPEAPEVPAIPVNGLNAGVLAGTTELRCVISSTPIKTLDTTTVTLEREETFYVFAGGDIAILGGTDNTIFDITQMNLMIDGSPWIYENGDKFWVKVVGVDMSGYGLSDFNIVGFCRDILTRFGGLADPADFDSSWDTIAAKAAPPQSAVSLIEGRVWLQESINAMEYALSLLEQIRVEAYVNRDNKFALSTLHFEDFLPAPTFELKNWHVVRGSFKPEIDERNNFNRGKADYLFSPVTNEAKFSTAVYRNETAITQSSREISKLISYPNLIDQTDVVNQLTEVLRLAGAYSEFVTLDTTWIGQQLDISDEINIDNIDIGSINFQQLNTDPVTGKIRDVSYNPSGKITIRIWSFLMLTFPGSLKINGVGITGGFDISITKET